MERGSFVTMVYIPRRQKIMSSSLLCPVIMLPRKKKVQCLFKIAYSHQGKKVKVNKPGIFDCAKITQLVTTHTCGMWYVPCGHMHCPIEDWSFGGEHLGNEGYFVSSISDPSSALSNSLSKNYIPDWKGVPAQYVQNFRRL
jgi:hypothetical protein